MPPEAVLSWISRPGWGLAHLLQADAEHEWMGATYTKTLCGRRVRADQVSAEPYADRCKTCSKRAGEAS